jgi:hypothetical protein
LNQPTAAGAAKAPADEPAPEGEIGRINRQSGSYAANHEIPLGDRTKESTP